MSVHRLHRVGEARSLTTAPPAEQLRRNGVTSVHSDGTRGGPVLAQPAGARDPADERPSSPDLQGPALRQMRFAPDGKLVSYLRGRDDAPAVFDLWAYDVARKTHHLLVDSRLLAPAEEKLSAEEEARRERQRIAALRGIVDYQWSPDSRASPSRSRATSLIRPHAAGGRGRAAPHADGGNSKPTRSSPARDCVSFIRTRTSTQSKSQPARSGRLTTGGGGLISQASPTFIAQEEMNRETGYWWSPDEKHLA